MAIKKININGTEHELIASKLGSSSAGSGGAVWHLSSGVPIEDPESYGSYDTPIFIKKGTYTPVSSIDSDLLPDATPSIKGAVIVDESLSETSINPVQNQAVTNWLNENVIVNTFSDDNSGNVTISSMAGIIGIAEEASW